TVAVLGPDDLAVGAGARVRVDDLQRRLVHRRDGAGSEIDEDQLRQAKALAHGDGALAVRKWIGVLHVGEVREPRARAGGRRPAKEIVVQYAVAVGLLVRVDDRRAV